MRCRACLLQHFPKNTSSEKLMKFAIHPKRIKDKCSSFESHCREVNSWLKKRSHVFMLLEHVQGCSWVRTWVAYSWLDLWYEMTPGSHLKPSPKPICCHYSSSDEVLKNLPCQSGTGVDTKLSARHRVPLDLPPHSNSSRAALVLFHCNHHYRGEKQRKKTVWSSITMQDPNSDLM